MKILIKKFILKALGGGHKYIKREGTPGHYKYFYRLPDGSIGSRADLKAALKKRPATKKPASKKSGRNLPDGVSEQDVLDIAHDVFKKNPKITLLALFRAVKAELKIPKDNYDYEYDLVIQDDPTFTRIPIGSSEDSDDQKKEADPNRLKTAKDKVNQLYLDGMNNSPEMDQALKEHQEAQKEGKTALQRAKEEADKITAMKKEAIKNGTNKITYTSLNGKPINLYYHSGRWNDKPSTVGEYNPGKPATEQAAKPKTNYTDIGSLKTDYTAGKVDFNTAIREYMALVPKADKDLADGDVRNWKLPRIMGKWENPYKKYGNIPDINIANTMSSLKAIKDAKDPVLKGKMVDTLVKKWKMTKEDAETFMDTLANLPETERIKAERYAKEYQKTHYGDGTPREKKERPKVERVKAWENPLAKYEHINPREVASTMAQAHILAPRLVGTSNSEESYKEEKERMVNALVKRGISKEDATAFTETIAHYTEGEQNAARKYVDRVEFEEKAAKESEYEKVHHAKPANFSVGEKLDRGYLGGKKEPVTFLGYTDDKKTHAKIKFSDGMEMTATVNYLHAREKPKPIQKAIAAIRKSLGAL